MPGPTNRPITGNSTTVINETTVQNILNQEIFNNTGYTSIGDVINNLQANGGEIIELGDIGFTDETTVYDFINGSGESWQLEENTMYFFTAESGDYSHLYYWQGDTPLNIGAGGTPVTVDDFEVLLISDNSKPEIPDNSLPKGLAGQAYYIKQGNEVEPDYTLKRGIVAETEAEFTEATTQEISLAEVFNEWQFFSHSGSKNAALASPPNYPGLDPGGFGGTPLTQAIVDKKQAWGYDPINDRIFLTQNFGVYSGFVSPKNYTNYVLEASLSSPSSDDDYLGLVMAFQKDPVTGFEYTISVVRVLNELSGQGNITYAVYYNFFQNGSKAPSLAVTTQIALVDGTNLAPIIDGQGNGWVGNHCKLRVERVGDVFTVKTSQFGSYDIDDATLLTINLNDTPELERFKTGGQVGFSALSQANAYFDDVYFTGFNEYILDLRNGYDAPRIFSFDFENNLWAEDLNLTYNDIWGVNRLIYTSLFGKTYYLGSNFVQMIGQKIRIQEPILNNIIPDSNIPGSSGDYILEGAYFNPQMSVAFEGDQTVNYIKFISDNTVKVNLTLGNQEGMFGVTLNNGVSKYFPNILLVVLGEVYAPEQADWSNITEPINILKGGLEVKQYGSVGYANWESKPFDVSRDFAFRYRYKMSNGYSEAAMPPGGGNEILLVDSVTNQTIIQISPRSGFYGFNYRFFDGEKLVDMPGGLSYVRAAAYGDYVAEFETFNEIRYVGGVWYVYVNGNLVRTVNLANNLTNNLVLKCYVRYIDLRDIKYIELAT